MKVGFALSALLVMPILFAGCGSQNQLAQFGKFRLSAFSPQNHEDPKSFGDPVLEPELGFVEALAMADEIEGATLIAAVGENPAPPATPATLPAMTPALMTAGARADFTPTPVVSRAPVALPAPAAISPPAHVAPNDDRADRLREQTPHNFVVKTTAYTHEEADSLKYGTKSALGQELKFGSNLRSAAADWSRFPVGTRFKIKGLPYEYVVDDYGRALVGTDTIDLYKPNMSAMNQWGARHVGIEVLEWGSFNESKKILETRKHKAEHVRKMLQNIEEKMPRIPEALRDGFEI